MNRRELVASSLVTLAVGSACSTAAFAKDIAMEDQPAFVDAKLSIPHTS